MCLKVVYFLLIVVLIKKANTYKNVDLTEEKYNDRLSNSGFSNEKSDDVGIYYYLKISFVEFFDLQQKKG